MELIARRLVGILFAGALASAVHLRLPRTGRAWARMDGKVTDESGAPLAGVTVKLELPERGGGTTVTTDKKGRWAVGGIAAGTWHIDFELAGHASRRVSVSLPSESSRLAPLEVKLEKEATSGVTPRRARPSSGPRRRTRRAGSRRRARSTPPSSRCGPTSRPASTSRSASRGSRRSSTRKAVDELEQVLAAEPDNAQIRAIAAQAALEGGMAEKGRQLLAGLSEGSSRTPTSTSTSASTS